jgi:hypothetical protein
VIEWAVIDVYTKENLLIYPHISFFPVQFPIIRFLLFLYPHMKCDFKFLLKYHKKCTLLFMYLTNGIVAVQIHSLVYYSCSFPYIAFSTVDILIAAAIQTGILPCV